MNKLMIIGYISKLKKEDIKRFSLEQGIDITEEELVLIYNYLKNETKKTIDNPLEVIESIKDKVSQPVYNKINELYEQYKNKIS